MDADTTWPSAQRRPKHQVAEHVCCGASGGLPLHRELLGCYWVAAKGLCLKFPFYGHVVNNERVSFLYQPSVSSLTAAQAVQYPFSVWVCLDITQY